MEELKTSEIDLSVAGFLDHLLVDRGLSLKTVSSYGIGHEGFTPAPVTAQSTPSEEPRQGRGAGLPGDLGQTWAEPAQHELARSPAYALSSIFSWIRIRSRIILRNISNRPKLPKNLPDYSNLTRLTCCCGQPIASPPKDDETTPCWSWYMRPVSESANWWGWKLTE